MRHLTQYEPMLLRWVSCFEGIESNVLHCQDLPASQIRAVFESGETKLAQLAQALSQCEFLSWRARSEDDGAIWDWRASSLTEFIRAHEQVVVWQSQTQSPEPAEVVSWLMTELQRS
jgi:hypothetical protein